MRHQDKSKQQLRAELAELHKAYSVAMNEGRKSDACMCSVAMNDVRCELDRREAFDINRSLESFFVS